ncbi:hypothetical protein KGP36_03220 [Patescibacteria group bacterium]|nr:hypothetical protein [Patescibacteria group bacterium]
MKYDNIGSISSGTLRPEDLIPAMIWEAKQHHLSREYRNQLRRIISRVANAADDYWESDDAHYDMEELYNILESVAPPYFYFGAHPGDGADIGFWLCEGIDEIFEGLRVNDLSEVPTGYTGEVLHVNDHGNTSLYRAVRGRLYEVWAIV